MALPAGVGGARAVPRRAGVSNPCICKHPCVVHGESPTTTVHAPVRRAIALPSIAIALAALALPTHTAAAASGSGAGPRVHARQARACTGANLWPTSTNTARIQSATLCLIDRVRLAHGLRALRANRRLRAVAMSQVRSMVRLNYFADVRPSGLTPLALILASSYGRGARSVSAAQSVGWGTQTLATPAQMVAGWLRSPPHRAIILTRKFRDAGIGAIAAAPAMVAQGQAGATYALEVARQQR
jgi:uncharacterized protein YkwD